LRLNETLYTFRYPKNTIAELIIKKGSSLGKLLDNCVPLLIVTVSGRSPIGGGDPLPVVPHRTPPRSAPAAIPCSESELDPLLGPSSDPLLNPSGALCTGLSYLFDTLPSPAAQVSTNPPSCPGCSALPKHG
jgi:hypothetical protein